MEELAILLLGCIPVIPALGKWSQVNPWGFRNSYPNLVSTPLRLVRDPCHKGIVTWGIHLRLISGFSMQACVCTQAPKAHVYPHPHEHTNVFTHQTGKTEAIRREGWRKEGGSNWGRGGREGRRGERFLKELIECVEVFPWLRRHREWMIRGNLSGIII